MVPLMSSLGEVSVRKIENGAKRATKPRDAKIEAQLTIGSSHALNYP